MLAYNLYQPFILEVIYFGLEPRRTTNKKTHSRFRLPTAVYLKAPLSALLELLFAFWKPS
jgi:hypothetical protein